MDANVLYMRLEKDFIKPSYTDDWANYMGEIREFISPQYMKRSMGLVCDNASEINKVYTAVFPSYEVIRKVLDTSENNIMLFVHHPAIWDIRNAPNIFTQMDRSQLKELRDRKISIYNLHVPLDDWGQYSTGYTLAQALDVKPLKAYASYQGSLAGVIGKTELKKVEKLKYRFQLAVGHKVALYKYGSEDIKDGKVALIAGGGDDVAWLEELAKKNINTFITGVSLLNNHSRKAHEYAKSKGINILGGTHYSTEKFACIAMCDYFKKLGLKAEFIEDKPILEDM